MDGGRRGRRYGRGRGRGRAGDQEGSRKPVEEQSRVPSGQVGDQMTEALLKISEVLERLAGPQGQVSPAGHIGGEDRTLERFQSVNPPKFAGDADSEVEANEWIRRMDTLFDVLGYSGERQVALAVFQLEGPARAWWNVIQEKWDQELVPRTWANFSIEFKMKFMPLIVHEQKVIAFSRCSQGNGSVAQYERHFSELAQSVPEMVATEYRKIQRFIQGLDVDIQGIVAATPVKSYAEVVEKALEIESAKVFERQDKGKRKSMAEDSSDGVRENIPLPKVAQESEIGASDKTTGSLGFMIKGAQASGLSKKKQVPFGGRCHYCKKPGHLVDECWRRSRKCFRCGSAEHRVAACPKLRERNETGGI